MLKELDLEGAENEKNLRAMEMIYKVHNGQDILYDQEVVDGKRGGDSEGIFKGVFGGYSAYNHVVCTRLFPLKRVIFWTKRFKRQIGLGTKIIVAASFNLRKIFLLDSLDGRMHIFDSGNSTHYYCYYYYKVGCTSSIAATPRTRSSCLLPREGRLLKSRTQCYCGCRPSLIVCIRICIR